MVRIKILVILRDSLCLPCSCTKGLFQHFEQGRVHSRRSKNMWQVNENVAEEGLAVTSCIQSSLCIRGDAQISYIKWCSNCI